MLHGVQSPRSVCPRERPACAPKGQELVLAWYACASKPSFGAACAQAMFWLSGRRPCCEPASLDRRRSSVFRG
eukprot:10293683-Lingulodinium_polyedra.AAC.1